MKDCECIGLTVNDKITGETVKADLDKIFAKVGKPLAIIKDGESTLNKGVRLWREKQAGENIPIIADIGQSMALALKAQFEKTKEYKVFTSNISHAA